MPRCESAMGHCRGYLGAGESAVEDWAGLVSSMLTGRLRSAGG